MASYPDPRFRVYIVSSIREGFQIGFDINRVTVHPSASRNMPSMNERPEVVDAYLVEECSQGRVGGPLDPAMHLSRFGVIPKSTPGKWRLIVDISFPQGGAVNDVVRESTSILPHVGIWDAVKEIVTMRSDTQLAMVDIQSAYRNVPVHPKDRWL